MSSFCCSAQAASLAVFPMLVPVHVLLAPTCFTSNLWKLSKPPVHHGA